MGLRSWEDTDLVRAVTQGDSWMDVLRSLGLVAAGGNFKSIQKHVLRLGLSTLHFGRRRRIEALGKSVDDRRLTDAQIFCKGSHVKSAKVAALVRKSNLLGAYECEICGNTGVHHGSPLVLQLDHRSGVGNDNRPENLRWLCPNCHSQTPTFAGRSRGWRQKDNKPGSSNGKTRGFDPRHEGSIPSPGAIT